jgi:hypothetical protein
MARVDDPFHYLDRAFEYYMTGRFAALNNLLVAPNLFHHAVEMLAKFQLLRRLPDDRLAEQVKRLKRNGHDLRTCGQPSRLPSAAQVSTVSMRLSPT